MKKSQKNFAVIGNPISHSISPVLFANFAKNLKKDYYYSRILCDNLIDAVDLIEAFEIQGINITAPFKRDILKYIDVQSEDVEKLGVANTVVWKEQKTGFNTDIEGVSFPLKDYLQDNKKVLVIGAGGAAVAAVYAMKKNNIKDVFIANRTISKAKLIAEKFDIHVL
ncbi:MAG TPA: shikimate dehydrogenase, partial [Bacteroidetes bacterium]|nr:shikimate dehydrogenase [Bacteroidota bacterium]